MLQAWGGRRQVSLVLWSTWEPAAEYLGGGVETELLKDLALARCEASRLHFAAKACAMDNEHVIVESSQNGLRGGAPFFDRRVVGNVLTIDSLDEEVERQSNHQQKHQSFDTAR